MRKTPYWGKVYLFFAVLFICLPTYFSVYEIHSGNLLVATGFQKGVFTETVVFLDHHSLAKAHGVIINSPLKEPPEDIIEEIRESKLPLYYGGPVDFPRSIFVLRSIDGEIILEELTEEQKAHPLLVKELIKELEDNVENQKVKVILGYSGWAPLQLNFEIMKGYWGAIETDPLLVDLKPTDSIWRSALEKLLEKVPENNKNLL